MDPSNDGSESGQISSDGEAGKETDLRPGQPISRTGEGMSRKKTKKKKAGKNGKHKIISKTYRRLKCEHYNRGNCKKGEECTYRHDFQPLSSKIICKYFIMNTCDKGELCKYSHDTRNYPCKFHHIDHGCLAEEKCRFSHEPVDCEIEEEFFKDNHDEIILAYQKSLLWNNTFLKYFTEEELKQNEPKLKLPQEVEPKIPLKKDPRNRQNRPVASLPKEAKKQENQILIRTLEPVQKQAAWVGEEELQERVLYKIEQFLYAYF